MLNSVAKFKIEYLVGDSARTSESLSCADFSATLAQTEGALKLELVPKVELLLKSIKVTLPYAFSGTQKVFLNGYQSWTNCREVTKNDRVYGIKPLAQHIPQIRAACNYFGDYTFHAYGGKGVFHGYTYGYAREGSEVTLFGSLNEDFGFTIFNFNMQNNTIVIEKEVENMVVSKAFCVLDIRAYCGAYEAVFDRYFGDMNLNPPRLKKLNGYTSWYNYFQKINRDIILNDLAGLSEISPKADIFQIDDGWQTKVGDWLSVDKAKFANGMGEMAKKIHEQGMMAGLWLAPFLAEKKSELVHTHPDWLLKDKNGAPLMGNIGWSGAYILDFYNPEVQQYLKTTFAEVLDKWNFDLVKLDFLYAVCLYPQHGKSRGQVMAEAMDFLRSLVGDKYILGCGVPLGSAFGRVDLCRISADVDLSYKEKFYSRLSNREIISTRTALENTVFRRHLDGRAFGNDPDVFFLRDQKLAFSAQQKSTLCTINSLLGTVRFVSDNIKNYTQQQKSQLSVAFATEKAVLKSAEMGNKNKEIKIEYQQNGVQKQLIIPLK